MLISVMMWIIVFNTALKEHLQDLLNKLKAPANHTRYIADVQISGEHCMFYGLECFNAAPLQDAYSEKTFCIRHFYTDT